MKPHNWIRSFLLHRFILHCVIIPLKRVVNALISLHGSKGVSVTPISISSPNAQFHMTVLNCLFCFSSGENANSYGPNRRPHPWVDQEEVRGVRSNPHLTKKLIFRNFEFHYENTPIQIYRKYHLQELKIFR